MDAQCERGDRRQAGHWFAANKANVGGQCPKSLRRLLSAMADVYGQALVIVVPAASCLRYTSGGNKDGSI